MFPDLTNCPSALLAPSLFDSESLPFFVEDVYKRQGELVVALIADSVTVKRFFKEDGHIRLQPENDLMEPIIVDDCAIVGIVRSLYRRIV